MNRRRFLKDSALYSGMLGAWGWMGGGAAGLPAQDSALPVGHGIIDLRDAVVVAPDSLSRREQKAVQVLVEEVEKRTELRWPVVDRLESGARPAIVVGTDHSLKNGAAELPSGLVVEGRELAGPEGYRLHTSNASGSTLVLVSGAGAWSWRWVRGASTSTR